MRSIFVTIALSLPACLLSACGLPNPTMPTSTPNTLRPSCGESPDSMDEWQKASNLDPVVWAQANRAQPVTSSFENKNLIQFNFEFMKVPEVIRVKLVSKNHDIHLIHGKGVMDDPTWHKDYQATPDGRSWSTVPGAGGGSHGPTRIVINSLYQNHGSINLVLHEYAHTLDDLYLNSHSYISLSTGWLKAIRSENDFQNKLSQICPLTYCTGEGGGIEGFAELFAQYHACDQAQAWMKKNLPHLSRFFESWDQTGQVNESN